jgi:hypothetical protein
LGKTTLNNDLSVGNSITVYDIATFGSNVTVHSNLDVLGSTTLRDDLSVENFLTVSNSAIFSSNVTIHCNLDVKDANISNLHVTGEIIYDEIGSIELTTTLGSITVTGDLNIHGVLTIGECNTEFPLIPDGDDVSKILGINRDSNYMLMTLFHERRACEFKSLFGRFQTGVELTQFSGLFDFGVPKSWLSGWKATLFDGALYTDEPTGILAPGSSSNINTDFITEIERFQTNGMEFKDFVNISMYKTNGQRMNQMAGIAVYDDVGHITPDYYFFLETIDPNRPLFRNKFKNDFDTFYSKLDGSNYGYSVDVDSIYIPHENLHMQGTNMFTVSFINTYDNTVDSNLISASSSNYKFAKPDSGSDRSNIYYVNSNSIYTQQHGTGLFPYLTYKTWRNSIDAKFHEAVYSEDIGWGNVPNVDDVFSNQHPNSNLKKLFKYTYNYIKTGNSMVTPLEITDTQLEQAYDQIFVSSTHQPDCNLRNIALSSNINLNDNKISNNINSVYLKQNVFTNIDDIIAGLP